jgi:quercetin 2,3-dioxygenase
MTGAAIERVERVGKLNMLAPGAKNRFVVDPATLDRQLPFILLVEDFIEPASGFHPHPHRGLETVTFVLSGRLRHGDHLGNRGILGAGDVQWMTAGRGIEHGGEPVEGPVHALQLWLALPAHLRGSAPGTRAQHRQQALLESGNGCTVRVYGIAAEDAAPWSQWPLTIRHMELGAGTEASLPLGAGERAFLYVLEGAPCVDGRPCTPGDVVWFTPGTANGRARITAEESARLIAYASPAFAEPIVARGPFVGGNMAEIEAAFADARAGRLLDEG